MQIQKYTVDSDMDLEANSYYSGASVWITEHSFAHIAFVTDDQPVKLGDAVIARLEFYFSTMEEEDVLENIMFNGVPVSELTREKAEELYPDFTGNSVAWFSTGLREYKYDMDFNSQTGQMMGFTVERKYDVDWNG